MGINDLSFSADKMDELAEKLALLYVQKSGKAFTSPKEFTHFYVQTHEMILDELNEIRKNG